MNIRLWNIDPLKQEILLASSKFLHSNALKWHQYSSLKLALVKCILMYNCVGKPDFVTCLFIKILHLRNS